MSMNRLSISMRKASNPNGIFPFKASPEELPSRLAKLIHVENRVFTRQAQKLIEQGELSILTTREAYLFTVINREDLAS